MGFSLPRRTAHQLPMKRIHEDSRISYAEGLREGVFNQRERDILLVLAGSRSPLSDREIANQLGFQERNAVSPRLTHLIELGTVNQIGTTICPVTRKTVRTCWIPPCPAQLELLGVA